MNWDVKLMEKFTWSSIVKQYVPLNKFTLFWSKGLGKWKCSEPSNHLWKSVDNAVHYVILMSYNFWEFTILMEKAALIGCGYQWWLWRWWQIAWPHFWRTWEDSCPYKIFNCTWCVPWSVLPSQSWSSYCPMWLITKQCLADSSPCGKV